MANQKTLIHPDFSFLEIPGQDLNILSNEFVGRSLDIRISTFTQRDSEGTLFLMEIDILISDEGNSDNCLQVHDYEVINVDDEGDIPENVGLALVIVTDKTDPANIRVNKRRTAGRIRGVVKSGGSK